MDTLSSLLVFLPTLLLTGSLVVIGVLVYRLFSLKAQMESQIRQQVSAWRERELERVRQEQGEVARREAGVYFQQWKKEHEQSIRRDAIQRSQAVTLGRITEHFVPYLPDFDYNPKDARFLGSPIDFVVFDGLSEGQVKNIVFVEVKTGVSALSTRERRIRDAVQSGRVLWQECRYCRE
jgi:predicted Holliday junction resolvase-like endonuclease